MLTLLSDSVMVGVSAFAFSTVAITFLGEIAPQAYFSPNALRMAAALAPVLNAHHFLRDTLFDTTSAAPEAYWHRPITVTDSRTRLGDVISRMYVRPERPEDDVIDHDLILLWGEEKRIITGADLLGRLLRGIAGTEPPARI